ncbi:MAG: hypothetical protein IBX39_08030 [Candidatus Methanoperedenaceae archaeon]|nr:hypothetical protein [Candidatus Methanoperedenaceae archaeon]MDW7725577.1 hypothetical protein [Candidatus Methanoperedens sp.]
MHPETAKAFAPAHISGIFIICTDTDPLLSGSMGAGILNKMIISDRINRIDRIRASGEWKPLLFNRV